MMARVRYYKHGNLYKMTLALFVSLCPNVSSEYDKFQLKATQITILFCKNISSQDLYQMTLALFVSLCPNVSSEHDK